MRFKILIFLLFVITVYGYSQESQETSSESAGWYQGKPIKDIVFAGLKNLSQSDIEALVIPYKGRIYESSLSWEIQGKLYALGYFRRIDSSFHRADASGSEVIIRFTVVELPIVNRINFTGLSGLRPKDLLDVISTKVNDFFNQAKIREDMEAIRNKYLEKGYPNVIVQVSEIQSGESAVTVVFNVVEREKHTIIRIDFQGNTRFTSNALKGQLSLKAKSLLNDGAFQESKLLADIEAINKYYRERGYIDAEVTDYTLNPEDEDSSKLVITFKIEEGEQYTFGGVSFSGNEIFSSEQLGKLIYSKTGDIVNETRLEADLQRVSDLYYENGYIYNSISRRQVRANNVLSYNINIVERGRAHIENILVLGNIKTKTDVILREIPLEPGDIFSKTKIMEAMRNLYNLQFFSMIIPETPQGSAESLMDLVFTVEEQPTTDVQFGLTFSGSTDPDTFPISGMLKWNDRNFLGSGNQLGAELNSSVIDTTTFSLNYLHRWIFGLPLSGGVDFTLSYSNRYAAMDNQLPIFNGDEPYAYPDGFDSYEEYIKYKRAPREYLMDLMQWYISLGFSTGYRWNTFLGNLSVNGGIRIGIVKNSYDENLFRPFDPAIRARNNMWTPKNSFWFSVSLDQRDIFYDPSSGYYLYERLGFYGIFNQEREHYIRSDTKAEFFITLLNIPVTEKWSFKTVLGIHTGLSFIFSQPGRNPDSKVPPIEDVNKLSVDGMFVGRGWSNEYYNKGLLLWDNWIELRIPIVHGILAFDLFIDAAGVETQQGYYFGTNQEGESNFTIDNMRFSFGGGLRFTMPQFPFRLSIAKRFRFEDGKFTWEPGSIFGNPSRPGAGVDLVISFVLSY
jgi:outer membrane protein insertion porin family